MRFLWWYFGSDLSPQSFCVSGQSTVRVGVQGDWWRSSSIKRVTIPQCRLSAVATAEESSRALQCSAVTWQHLFWPDLFRNEMSHGFPGSLLLLIYMKKKKKQGPVSFFLLPLSSSLSVCFLPLHAENSKQAMIGRCHLRVLQEFTERPQVSKARCNLKEGKFKKKVKTFDRLLRLNQVKKHQMAFLAAVE